ncbi:MAG: alkaline phosphatase D family protein [Caldilineaceae bacterium]
MHPISQPCTKTHTGIRYLRAKIGAVLFIALSLCSALILFITGWSVTNADELAAVPTVPPVDSLPNGIAAGDVSQESVVLWTRSEFPGVITFSYHSDVSSTIQVTRAVVDPYKPLTVTVNGLSAGTRYTYTVVNAFRRGITGTFQTAAAVGAKAGLRFGVSGDWRGELVPYPAARNAIDRDLNFFIALGDTAYADVPSPQVPLTQATTLQEFRLKHTEPLSRNLDMNTLVDIRANMALFATIDDHEVNNNFSGGANASTDPRFAETSGFINDTSLYELGTQAFGEYYPIQTEYYGVVGGDGRMDNEHRFYRYRTFGSDAALFVLDSRSFRDAPIQAVDLNNVVFDTLRFLNQAFTAGRTLLGSQQLQDLQRDLLDAQQKGITWKFVAIPEPIQNIGPIAAEDRFEGYAAERAALLKFIAENEITNVVFVSADIHGTFVNNVTYQEGFGQSQKDSGAFEVTTGSLAYDAPFGPTVVTIGADAGLITPTTVSTYNTLPVMNDPDSIPNDKDDLVKSFLDYQLGLLGYDKIGLDSSLGLTLPYSATLLQGDYFAVHTFGWSEFDIDAATQVLTVTTYGVPAYTANDIATDPAGIIDRTPAIVSQFRVQPVLPPAAAADIYLPYVAQ